MIMQPAPRRSRKTGPSIEDVARIAGVSAQTVSRVSTGSQQVRPSTRERVLRAMDQLGYSPNQAARALRNGSFQALGLLAHGFSRTDDGMITQAIVAAAGVEGYSVTLLGVNDPASTGWEASASRLSDQAVDGLIIIRAETETPDSLALSAGMPIAVSDSRLVGFYPAVGTNQAQGSMDAVNHLLSLGHKTVHHIAGPEDSHPANQRLTAWRRCLEDAGITPPPEWRGNWTAGSGYDVGQEILADPSVTAVFCANDEMAFGLIRALHEAGRRVPEDISIVGFDDLALGAYLYPPLTTVRQDYEAIGRELIRLVLDQIHSHTRLPAVRVVVPTELVIRKTTCPPPSQVLGVSPNVISS